MEADWNALRQRTVCFLSGLSDSEADRYGPDPDPLGKPQDGQTIGSPSA